MMLVDEMRLQVRIPLRDPRVPAEDGVVSSLNLDVAKFGRAPHSGSTQPPNRPTAVVGG